MIDAEASASHIAVRKKLGLTLVSEKLDGERVYRIVSTQSRKSTDGSQDHVTIGPSQTAPGIADSGLCLAPPSNRPLRSGVPVKVHAVCGRRDEPGTYHKGAKPLPRFALGRIGGEDWGQLCHDGGMVKVFGIELRES